MLITDIIKVIIDFLLQKKVYGPIITIIIALIAYRIFLNIINKIALNGKSELDKKRKKTIMDLFKNIGKYVIVVIALLIILEIYGIDTTSLIAGFGVIGLVVGLALQDTLKDFISGVSVIMDNYFVVGDIVEYNGFKGEVISFGLRCTKIKKYSGEVLTFANRNMAQIINYSQKNASIFLEISVSSEENNEKIEEILNELIPNINELKNVIEEGAKYLGITNLNGTQVTYSLSIRSGRLTQNTVKREVLKIVQDTFKKSKTKIVNTQFGG